MSMLIPLTVVLTVLPAQSAKLTVTDWFCPSVATFRSISADPFNPDRASVALKCTRTAALFQPFAFAAVRVNVTVGPVLSIFTVGDANVAVLPARSVTTTVPFTLEPSVVNRSGLGVEVDAKPDRLSDAVKLIWTSLLFQPAAFAAGFGAPNWTVGAVRSM